MITEWIQLVMISFFCRHGPCSSFPTALLLQVLVYLLPSCSSKTSLLLLLSASTFNRPRDVVNIDELDLSMIIFIFLILSIFCLVVWLPHHRLDHRYAISSPMPVWNRIKHNHLHSKSSVSYLSAANAGMHSSKRMKTCNHVCASAITTNYPYLSRPPKTSKLKSS